MAYQFPTSSSATHGVASTSPGIVLGVSQHDLLELVDKMPPPDFTNAVDSINEVNAWLKKLFWRRDIELLSPSPSVSDGEEPPLGPKTITQVPWTGRDLHQAQYLDLFDLFHERMGMPVVSASIVSSDIEFCLEVSSTFVFLHFLQPLLAW